MDNTDRLLGLAAKILRAKTQAGLPKWEWRRDDRHILLNKGYETEVIENVSYSDYCFLKGVIMAYLNPGFAERGESPEPEKGENRYLQMSRGEA